MSNRLRNTMAAATAAGAALLAGCGGGPGWVRLEPLHSARQRPLVMLDATAYCPGSQSSGDTVLPVAFAADGREVDDYGFPVRTWALVGLADPSDVPGRAEVVLLLGTAAGDAELQWQLWTGVAALEMWRYAGRQNLFGRVQPRLAAPDDATGPWRLAASLRPSADKGAYRRGLEALAAKLGELADALDKQLAVPGRPGERAKKRQRALLADLIDHVKARMKD